MNAWGDKDRQNRDKRETNKSVACTEWGIRVKARVRFKVRVRIRRRIVIRILGLGLGVEIRVCG